MTSPEGTLAALGDDALIGISYGASGIGKTMDQGYSFPRAFFVAAKGALLPIQKTCGYTPATDNVKNLKEGTALVKSLAKTGKYRTVVFDDFSFLVQQTFTQLEAKYSGFKLWGELRDQALEFRDVVREAKISTWLNCWEQAPKVKPDGTRARGGPQLSGNLPEQIPALADLVLRAVHEPARLGWPVCYRCAPDPSWVMKDRIGVATLIDPAPMNIAEILRARGIRVDRHPDLPWQEEAVEAISQQLTGVPRDDMGKINMFYTSLLQSGKSVPVVRWTIRDAVDRSVIRAGLDAANLYFFDPSKNHLLG